MRAIVPVVLAFGILLVPFAHASSESEMPRLQLVDRAPLVLRGTGFAPAERISVMVVTRDDEHVRRTRASRLGTFVVRFDLIVDSCYGAQRATAVGGRGNKAAIILERPWQRECVELGNAP